MPLHSRLDIDAFSATTREEQAGLTRLREPAAHPLPDGLLDGRRASGRSLWRSIGVLIRACRPRQWSKNLLVLAAPLAAGAIGWPGVAVKVAGAFVVLCMLSSATYLVNDVRDREQDRIHPRKRTRPIAAGELTVRAAIAAGLALAVAGLALAAVITPGLAAVGAGYLAVTMSYSLWWRRVVVADILAIAAGFVLRALAGGVATDIYLSRWFAIVTACGAIFLVAAKRYAELHEQVAPRLERATLRRYSLRGLRLTLAAAASLASIAYISWAFTRPSHLLWYGLSIVPFLLWLARYASLAGAGAAQAPEELILRDRTLLVLSLVWGLLFLGGVYVGR
ncbi:MAG TPA: decaprenyl-phosphate phosphoribosyltransferase [Solirubrobacteraceae bacterium]|nr:decaprenyl-phosphate phosphoribosyltransferase [Solirubrobacteraceae bacterium]